MADLRHRHHSRREEGTHLRSGQSAAFPAEHPRSQRCPDHRGGGIAREVEGSAGTTTAAPCGRDYQQDRSGRTDGREARGPRPAGRGRRCGGMGRNSGVRSRESGVRMQGEERHLSTGSRPAGNGARRDECEGGERRGSAAAASRPYQPLVRRSHLPPVCFPSTSFQYSLYRDIRTPSPSRSGSVSMNRRYILTACFPLPCVW